MKGKKWVLVKEFNGQPTAENLSLVEYDLPDELKPNEVLFQAVYLSVDPYMRIFPGHIGAVMQGEQLSEVIKTKNGQYPLGTLVLANSGWQSHFIYSTDTKSDLVVVEHGNLTSIRVEPIRFDLGATHISHLLGILGMPGATAHIALNKCQPKKDEIVLVSAAAGAVGNVVGQLAKLKGCKVIGLVGSEEKSNWCKNELGFDHVINYKTEKIYDALEKVAPDGVDIYFDNVGGDYYHNIIRKHMKLNGRVLVCGSIETYNDSNEKQYGPTNVAILMKELSVYGFMCFTHYEKWPESFVEMNKLIQSGQLKAKNHTYNGIENMLAAFQGLFKGENVGKALVKTINEQTHYGNL